MPRPFRYTLPGVPQHVVQRGNDRQPVFFSPDDYRFYKACLYEASRAEALAIHAYVLMTNHVHLLVTPTTRGAISRVLQSVGRRFVQFINLNHGRTGTLWEGRHKASIVQSERYFRACHAYIEQNPVRAGMVRGPLDYPWSSCRHYAGRDTDPLITDAQTFLEGGLELEARRVAHLETLRTELSAERLNLIRTQTERGGVIGDARFRGEIERMLGRRLPGAPRGRPRKQGTADEGNALAGQVDFVNIE